MLNRTTWSVFASDSLAFVPGTQWAYSNSNYLVLGAIIERVTGLPFATYVERHVFAPAGMSTTYASGRRPDRARGYTRARPGMPPGSAPDPERWSPVGIVADSADAGSGGPAGGGVTRTVLASLVPAEYGGADGYGFETRRWNGVRIVGHGGAFPGVSNQADFYPASGHAVIVLSNTDGSGAQALANYARSLIARWQGGATPGAI